MLGKPLEWVGSSKKDMRRLPAAVRQTFGYALSEVESGRPVPPEIDHEPFAQGGSGCMELKADDVGGTYRTMYVAKFQDAVYVLHCFAKKSKTGKATPAADVALIQQRYKEAERQSKVNQNLWTAKHK